MSRHLDLNLNLSRLCLDSKHSYFTSNFQKFICLCFSSKTSSSTSGDHFRRKNEEVFIKTESGHDSDYFEDFSGGLPLKVHLKEESENDHRGGRNDDGLVNHFIRL
jgi:hypothetical protein